MSSPDDTEPTIVNVMAKLMAIEADLLMLEADGVETSKMQKAHRASASTIEARLDRQNKSIKKLKDVVVAFIATLQPPSSSHSAEELFVNDKDDDDVSHSR